MNTIRIWREGPMRRTVRLILLLSLSAGLGLVVGGERAPAQEMEIIAGGEIEYQNHCAVCHGVDARGQGLMSKFLTVRPADLTQLKAKNGGTFPFWRTYRVIDGSEEVPGHGARDMPIWGDRFRTEAGGGDSGSRAQAAGRLIGLVFYLQHIQQ
jgi:mono/diheme cytochrome c family protein